jgi:hypothetical protein
MTTDILVPRYGGDLFGSLPGQPPPMNVHFPIPTVSVLSAREGWWQDRKRQWIEFGIRSELGRASDLVFWGGKPTSESRQRILAIGSGATSTFDPVLCEILYRWFCPAGGTVFDPFAGGSVRGIVASILNRNYLGIDLSEKQVGANTIQANELLSGRRFQPKWVIGDSAVLASRVESCDFLFSCPPYGDLEVYSEDPRDLSTMGYTNFIDTYRKIIARSTERLKQDRFACFVVGDFRDNDGNYHGFPSDTIRCFRDAGLSLYNDAILLTAFGSLPLRAALIFRSRKLGKAHQNILIFCKGDPRKAASTCEPYSCVADA